jgi:hypothetical protein
LIRLERISCHDFGIRRTSQTEARCLPPPKVYPETPTGPHRAPTTLMPLGTMYEYTSIQVSPAPISTVSESSWITMSLNLVIEICTPGVDENPGLRVCPPSLIANGVRVDASCWSCSFRAQYEEHGDTAMVERPGHLLPLQRPAAFQALPSTWIFESSSWSSEQCPLRTQVSLIGHRHPNR